MYTSTYSSSPVRTSTAEKTATNYQHQSYHRQYNQSPYNNDINTINDNNMALRRNVDGYSRSNSPIRSTPLSAPSSPRRYPNNYYNSQNDRNKYHTAAYSSSPSYRTYGNDAETFRPHSSCYNLSGTNRAYSYDDLLHEQNRYQSSIYNTRNTNQYRQQQQTSSRNLSYDYDDNYDDLIVKSTDLPAQYEQEMIDLVRTAFQKYEITNQRELAGYLKRTADKKFSPCWHCIVGKQFSSYVTHEMNGFVYFTKGPISILLFRSGA
ncbi:unnamed protein product [Rotaria sp. Silwood2]|nr:unnamed protein product [Rotaria sp. Silwood2]CAF2875914.1 unnamed protein product [Rotaria sp. Silwood2]CAF3044719.1 unnamed protein product [Rotaria sp. Silwood2]CAF4168632.1 unnamed protein product [Rotaria sp. Silwood2]CAF4227185.1 unnamed protein product [Rotaria sp. Silwood2]